MAETTATTWRVRTTGAKTQNGWAGHLLNGWSFAPIVTWQNGINSDPAINGSGINQYGNNAAAVYNGFRPMVLGLDTTGTSGVIPGFGVWNFSFALSKDILVGERWGADFSAQAANVFNHFQSNSGAFNYNGLGASNDIGNPAAFGVITTNDLDPRRIELGLRLHW